jgi:hypothetical protein
VEAAALLEFGMIVKPFGSSPPSLERLNKVENKESITGMGSFLRL